MCGQHCSPHVVFKHGGRGEAQPHLVMRRPLACLLKCFNGLDPLETAATVGLLAVLDGHAPAILDGERLGGAGCVLPPAHRKGSRHGGSIRR